MIHYRRRRDLPGIELRTAAAAAPGFRSYSTGFEFFAPDTWCGEIWHRRHRRTVGPGWVLSAHPGDVFVSGQIVQPGAWSSLTIDADVLASYVPDRAAWDGLQLRPFAKMSVDLARQLRWVMEALPADVGVRELRGGLSAFLATASRELAETDVIPRPSASRMPSRAAERFACFRRQAAGRVPLADLTNETGLSRFQALRAFKRDFGLTPHTYQLRVRLGLAQRSLRDGGRAADVAADLGFADQSHFTRHFKRFVGLTPTEYARGSA
jgi:AraC-like DNA-binding protein